MADTPPRRIAAILVGYVAWMCAVDALTRFAPVVGAVVFVVVPLIATWRSRRDPARDTFNAVKTYSALAGVWLILAARLWLGPDVAWWPWVIFAIFVVNIGEAIVSDALRGVWMNVVAGALLLVSVPGPATISLGSAAPHDVLWAMPWPWVLAYTAWNYAFLVNRRPYLASVHGAVLLAPLLGNALWPGIWAQSRAQTLTAHQLLSFGWWDRREALNVHGHDAGKARLARALQPLSLAVTAAAAASAWWR